jgi:transposase
VLSASFDTPEAEIAALRMALVEREAALAERDARLLNASLEIEKLKVQLAALRRDRYGRSSETRDAEIGQLEMLIGDLEEDAAGADAAARNRRKARGETEAPRRPAIRRPLPAHLPRETVTHEPAFACRCGCTDPARLTRLGEDVTEVLEKIPARLKVIRHIRPRYACRACEAVMQAPAPDLPVERGRPGPGLLAHVLVSKYLDGLPLYRLSGILAREGVEIERQTLADWVGRGAWWLRSLAELIERRVMAGPVIWTDDTPIAVLAPGRGRTREARFWVYAFDPRPWGSPRGGHGRPLALYRYSPDRKGERPKAHLAGFSGWMHADAYPGYDALTRPKEGGGQRITHVACWAHRPARRPRSRGSTAGRLPAAPSSAPVYRARACARHVAARTVAPRGTAARCASGSPPRPPAAAGSQAAGSRTAGADWQARAAAAEALRPRHRRAHTETPSDPPRSACKPPVRCSRARA